MQDELIIGGAGILPVDYTYLIPKEQSREKAENSILKLLFPVSEPPSVAFRYDSYQKSGGGQVANILAHLSALGHTTSIAGTVGSDDAGQFVLEDLKAHGVNVTCINKQYSKYTRLVFILYKIGTKDSKQIHLPKGEFIGGNKVRSNWLSLNYLPHGTIFITNRANKKILKYISEISKHGCLTSFHLGVKPWRNVEQSLFREAISTSWLVVASQKSAAWLGLKGTNEDRILLKSLGGPQLIVVFENPGSFWAVSKDFGVIKPDSLNNSKVIEPTGMLDAFHAGFLSYILRKGLLGSATEDELHSGLLFANQIAVACGKRVGARYSLLRSDLENLRKDPKNFIHPGRVTEIKIIINELNIDELKVIHQYGLGDNISGDKVLGDKK